MKNSIYIFFLFTSSAFFSQQTLIKSFSSNTNLIEISTEGLDEIKIINSDDEQIEVSLFDENPNAHHIIVEEDLSILKIGFKLQFIENLGVFKKFITKRLNRASVVVKLPKNKDLTIIGTNIDVISKNYKGNLFIYIDKGFVNLNRVQKSVDIKLFQGNVFATIFGSNIDISSTKGKILVDKKLYLKNYKKETLNVMKTFRIFSINANINIFST